MKFASVVVLPVIAILTWGPPPARVLAQPVEPKRNLVMGAVFKKHAYTSLKNNKTFELRLIYAALPAGPVKETITFDHNQVEPDRWRIAYGHLWAISSWNDLAEVGRFFADSYNRIFLEELKRGKRCIGPEEGDDDVNVQDPFVYQKATPIEDIALFSHIARFPLLGYYDYVPLSADSARVFLLSNSDVKRVKTDAKTDRIVGDIWNEKWMFRARTCKTTTCRIMGKKDTQGTENHTAWGESFWTDEEQINVAFKEPFHAFISATDYLFVTESGKLYVSRKVAGKSPRTVEAIWDDIKKPITHVITDADQNKTYAFGRLPKEGDREGQIFFFCISEPRAPEFFDIDSLKSVKAPEPLASVMQFADVLARREERLKKINALQEDPKLQAKIEVTETDPELKDLLRRLEDATGLTLSVDPTLQEQKHQPKFGTLRLPNEPAHRILRRIAYTQLEDGVWEKTELGYRLVAKSSSSAKDLADKKAHKEALAKAAALATRFPLRFDATLGVKVPVVGTTLQLAELLEPLRTATGLKIVLADNLNRHDPKFGDVKLPDASAWMVMELIADTDLDNGRWEKTDGGYRLEGVSRSLRPAPGTFPWAWAAIVVALLLMAGGAFVIFRARGKKSAAGSS